MNSLLKRQIRKHLPEEFWKSEFSGSFLKAVSESYDNQSDQLAMLQRAIKISSDELFEANAKLSKKADNQKKIIDSLNRLVKRLDIKSAQQGENGQNEIDLAHFTAQQSEKILRIDVEKRQLLKDLEGRNQVLSDYAHMVSHDLKSPLRSIDSLVNWIVEDHKDMVDEKCSSQFQMILENVEKMDNLINGILKYSTIDQGKSETYKVNIFDIVTEIVQVLYMPKHVSILISKDLPVVQADKYRIQQLFQNIIQNAIRSIDKDEGKIEVGVTDKKNEWEFYVKDNGKGISEKHHKKIFQIFEKMDNEQSSTGIGLSIVKKIIDYYKGSIWLESQLGKGSIFYFKLPK